MQQPSLKHVTDMSAPPSGSASRQATGTEPEAFLAEKVGLLYNNLAYSVLINSVGATIVAEDAVRGALAQGRLRYVALDVFDDEPLPADSPWWEADGVLVTPHVAGLAPRYADQVLDLVVENLARLRAGTPLLNRVDRAAGY